MTTGERTFFLIALAALVAILIWDYTKGGPSGGATVSDNAPVDNVPLAPGESAVPGVNAGFQNAPAYLSIAAPWLFNPPVQNVLPVVTVGQTAQVATNANNSSSPLAY